METQTQEAGVQPVDAVTQPQAIEKANAGRPMWQPLILTDERLELMRKAICPPTASEGEFKFFVEWCRQTGLNPFLKQAYLIERSAEVDGKWVKKHDPMVAEAGFAARADALPDFGGMRSGVVYAGDEFMIDEVTQEITHRWSIAERTKNGTKVLGAWAHATRAGRVVEISWVTFESRVQRKRDNSPTKFWANDPAGQIRKCARADQYRRAFPNIFAGWYSDAEISDEVDLNPPPAPPPSKAPDAKSAALKARLGVKPVTVPSTVVSAPMPATDGRGVHFEAKPKPKPTPPKGTQAPPLDQIRFGPNKGKPIVDATTIELEEALDIAHKQLAQATGKEGWVKGVHEGVAAIDAEIERRNMAADEAEPEPSLPPTEPGSEG